MKYLAYPHKQNLFRKDQRPEGGHYDRSSFGRDCHLCLFPMVEMSFEKGLDRMGYRVFIKFNEIDIRVPYLVENYLNEQYKLGLEFVGMCGNLFVFKTIEKTEASRER